LKSDFLFINFDSKLHRDFENIKKERIISTNDKKKKKKNPTTTLNMQQWAIKEPSFPDTLKISSSKHGNRGWIGSPNWSMI